MIVVAIFIIYVVDVGVVVEVIVVVIYMDR